MGTPRKVKRSNARKANHPMSAWLIRKLEGDFDNILVREVETRVAAHIQIPVGDRARRVVVAMPAGKAALDKNLPGLTTHEHYEMFKGMTLNQIAPMAGDKMPAAALAKTKADLAAIR